MREGILNKGRIKGGRRTHKKTPAITVCVIILTGAIVALFFHTTTSAGNPVPISVHYYVIPDPSEFNITQYEVSSYHGWVTSVSIDAFFSSNKTVSFNCHNFYLTTKGKPTRMLYVDNSTINIEAGTPLFHQLNFEVEGNATSIQLAYHGSDVSIEQSSTPIR